MNVPFFRPDVSEEDISAVVATLRSGWLTNGPEARRFEASFAKYVGSAHAVATTSCTAALHIALAAQGIGPGDCVLAPTLTFAATAEIAVSVGATPVLVDCDETSLCMSPDEAAATALRLEKGAGRSRGGVARHPVRAIIPMHYGGQMADMARVLEVADRCGAAVVEDAAHTLPAAYRERSTSPWLTAGTVGAAGAYSFYANKCITTGDGGMLVTDSDEIAERARRLTLHGLSADAWKRRERRAHWYYEVVEPGQKCGMTDVAASLGLCQLARVNDFLAMRTEVAARYSRLLSRHDDLELPAELPNRRHAWHLYAIRLRPQAWRIDRAAFIRELGERGVGCSVHWMPLHLQPYYRKRFGYRPDDFPVANRVWQNLVSLPVFPGMTVAEVEHVVGAIDDIRRLHGA